MTPKNDPKDAYGLILNAIDEGIFAPGDRLVESDLADRFGVSRTPVREALQRLETEAMLSRDGRSLIVASLDHNQIAEFYEVRSQLEGLAAALAAQHASDEEIRVLFGMIEADRTIVDDPRKLSRANRRFHNQIHMASRNRYLVRQLEMVHRSMALLTETSLAASGRGQESLDEHQAIVTAISNRQPEEADAAVRHHLSLAFETRLRLDAASYNPKLR